MTSSWINQGMIEKARQDLETNIRSTDKSEYTIAAEAYMSHLDNSNSYNSNSPLTRTKFPFPWSKFHWNLPRWLGFPMTRTVFRFSSEFELPGFYCSYSLRGVPQSWFLFLFRCTYIIRSVSQSSRLLCSSFVGDPVISHLPHNSIHRSLQAI